MPRADRAGEPEAPGWGSSAAGRGRAAAVDGGGGGVLLDDPREGREPTEADQSWLPLPSKSLMRLDEGPRAKERLVLASC